MFADDFFINNVLLFVQRYNEYIVLFDIENFPVLALAQPIVYSAFFFCNF